MFETFILSFIPLFVTVDALGTLPLYISLTKEMEPHVRVKLVGQAVLAALSVGLLFLFGGPSVFSFLGITADDFRIGGGILLLLVALSDLTSANTKSERQTSAEIAIVPLGIPLILGPASLTTILMQVNHYGYIIPLISLLLNLSIAYLMFRYSEYPLRWIGKGGALAFGKIASLFLLAIAIMMIRVGVTHTFPVLIK